MHPVDLFKLPSVNIAGGGSGSNTMGIVGDGKGGPIPAKQMCTMRTICSSLIELNGDPINFSCQ